jgi:DNA-binding SARP family transcriptional activator/tetratricopeptide (TPR) repeat protein
MWFGLLGTLQVRIDDREVRVPGSKQRVLLAGLLLTPGRAVSTARLCELVWDGQPPARAAVTLRSYVKRLRQALGPSGMARIIATSGGYRIDVVADEVDIFRFEDQLRAGISAAQSGDWERGAELLDQAQALWRGTPLADIPCQALQLAEAPRLEEQRLQAIQWRIEAALQLGDHELVTPELQSLTAEHPLREPFHGQLIVALYRAGRQADALGAFRAARDIMVSELGLEPGPELQLLHQHILAGDRELLARSASPPPVAGQAPAVPRQLPAPAADFTGRDAELAILAGLLDNQSAGAAATMLITAIGGTAGVGKTALAVRWGHQVAASFPDGQLYVNLRGYDPGQPMTAGDALARFLRALGMPGKEIPAEEDERAACFRSRLAGKRILIVLDNATEADQVRPLLPGTPGSLAVVTSRDALSGLVAREGARRLDLDLLPLGDAITLLRALIGARVDGEPEAATALALHCSRLPLALRVAAELAASRPFTSLASLAGELADRRQRLDLLAADGDQRTAVRAVFSWSLVQLAPGTARAFRLIGLHPGPDFDAYAAAALIGTSLEGARQLLHKLGRAYLIQKAGPGRYAMHDLLRDYARELAGTHDGHNEQPAALSRLFDHYLHAAGAAMNALYPTEIANRPRIPLSATLAPALAEPESARAWLDAELPCLVSVTEHAAKHGLPRHATLLSATLVRYLDAGHFSEAIAIHGHARSAAIESGDAGAEAGALTSLGSSELQRGRFGRASGHLEQALVLCRETGDRGGECRVLINLGILACRHGDYERAAGHLRFALSLSRATGNKLREAIALINLGNAEMALGQLDEAARHLEQALALSQLASDRHGEAYALLNLADIGLRQDRFEQAASHLDRVLMLSRESGDRVGEAAALNGLGKTACRQGHYQVAARHLREALAVSRDTGARSTEATTLALLGEVSLATGDHGQARSHYAAALALASDTGHKNGQAGAHDGLARASQAGADWETARHHWQQALGLYCEMGSPEADDIRQELARNDAAIASG